MHACIIWSRAYLVDYLYVCQTIRVGLRASWHVRQGRRRLCKLNRVIDLSFVRKQVWPTFNAGQFFQICGLSDCWQNRRRSWAVKAGSMGGCGGDGNHCTG
jgi:hypothetical protein